MPFIKSIRKQYDKPQQGPKVSDVMDVTGGDIIYTAGGYTIHMFTSENDSQFKMTPKAGMRREDVMYSDLNAEYLVVGGGAAAGSRHGGGGGAGGMVISSSASMALGTYPTSVGGGGGGIQGDQRGNPGGNTSLGQVTALGGGGGGTWAQENVQVAAQAAAEQKSY